MCTVPTKSKQRSSVRKSAFGRFPRITHWTLSCKVERMQPEKVKEARGREFENIQGVVELTEPNHQLGYPCLVLVVWVLVIDYEVATGDENQHGHHGNNYQQEPVEVITHCPKSPARGLKLDLTEARSWNLLSQASPTREDKVLRATPCGQMCRFWSAFHVFTLTLMEALCWDFG